MANEQRLIDANALIERFRVVAQSGGAVTYHVSDICAAIEDEAIEAPVDAVEVVRCKDCRSCKKHPTSDKVKMCTNENWNTEYYPLVHDNDFCSYGERREGE